jgi:polyisoprenyl-teichoic acid--peptidoglycan teichoic acid transferase
VFTRGGYEAVAAAGITDFESAEAEAPFREGGSSFFKRQVESLLGVTVDYTVVFNVELVGKVIDALGGVDVYLPEPMKYTDRAANLYIDLPAGNQRLNGEKAIGYLRFRHGYGSDYARMDRAKAVIGKLMQKLKSPAVLGVIPTLLGALQNDIVTNANTLELTQQLLPHLRNLTPRFYTLPTLEDARFGSYLQPETERIQALVQSIDNPTAINLETAPRAVPTIVNQSGVPNLGRALAAYFVRSGWGQPEVIDLEPSSEPTQVVRRQLGDAESAEFYANVLGTSLFMPYRYPQGAGDVAIVLGKDAGRKYGALVQEASRLRKP